MGDYVSISSICLHLVEEREVKVEEGEVKVEERDCKDHSGSLCGAKNVGRTHLLQLSYKPLKLVRWVPFDDNFENDDEDICI